MSNIEIIGHDHVIRYFRLLSSMQRIPGTYLFVGKEGIGKRLVARYIAMMINCPDSKKPCLVCASCNQISGGIHPDVREVYPENSIKIAQVREVQKGLFFKNFSSPFKVVIVDDADLLTKR